MTITAKFSSFCPRCHQRIEAGERVEWNPGEKARHASCTPAPVIVEQRIAVEDAGVYVLPDGTIIKMQSNKAKTATYPLRWKIITGERLSEADTHEHGEYEYLEDYGSRHALLNAVTSTGRKMSLDEARTFILRFGICARCSRQLKAAKSVERGIGPYCLKFFAGTTDLPSFQCQHGKSNHCTVDGRLLS